MTPERRRLLEQVLSRQLGRPVSVGYRGTIWWPRDAAHSADRPARAAALHAVARPRPGRSPEVTMAIADALRRLS